MADSSTADRPPAGAVTAVEGALDDSLGDGSLGDGSLVDGSLVDGSLVDGSLGDGSLGDGSLVDGSLVDGSLVDDEIVDDETGDDELIVDEPPEGAVPVTPSAPAATGRLPAYGSRREARERALSLLYEADAKSLAPAALLAEIPVVPPPFVVSVVAGVGECRPQIDELIDRFAIDWTIERMPVIDRTVIRMATFELLYRPDVPTGVVISEAVELAKRYSTDESGRFVNGLLASIASETRPVESPLSG